MKVLDLVSVDMFLFLFLLLILVLVLVLLGMGRAMTIQQFAFKKSGQLQYLIFIFHFWSQILSYLETKQLRAIRCCSNVSSPMVESSSLLRHLYFSPRKASLGGRIEQYLLLFFSFKPQTVNFTEPFYAPPVVLVTPKRSDNSNNNNSNLSGSPCNGVIAWVEVKNLLPDN